MKNCSKVPWLNYVDTQLANIGLESLCVEPLEVTHITKSVERELMVLCYGKQLWHK